jgi:mannosyl-oligosaccharide glucosidase
MLSNLIGGIGFFHGTDVVDRSAAPEYEEENEGFWEETEEARGRAQPVLEGPKDLFTSVPSRPFFPRGFLWDEGFHLIPILDWDPDLACVPSPAFLLSQLHSSTGLLTSTGLKL